MNSIKDKELNDIENENIGNKDERIPELSKRVMTLEKKVNSIKDRENSVEIKENQISREYYPIKYYPSHMCTSEYCLLCHGKYY